MVLKGQNLGAFQRGDAESAEDAEYLERKGIKALIIFFNFYVLLLLLCFYSSYSALNCPAFCFHIPNEPQPQN